MSMNGVSSAEASRANRFRQIGSSLVEVELENLMHVGTRERVLALHLGALTDLEPKALIQIERAFPLPSFVDGNWRSPAGGYINAREAARLISYRVSDIEMYLARSLPDVQFSRLLDWYSGPGSSGDVEATLAADRLRAYRQLQSNKIDT